MPTSLRITLCHLGVYAVLLAGFSRGLLAQVGAPPVLKVGLNNGQQLFGMPIHWSPVEAVLLENSGKMNYLRHEEISSHGVLKEPFLPHTPIEARHRLQQELGNSFEILIQGQYVIAAPSGHAARWRDRFQSLLSGYQRYFEIRGWPIHAADFPMIAIVFPDRGAFTAYCTREGQAAPPNVVGCYYPKSNRCVLYDQDRSFGANRAETEATIVHEAVHQLAYNTGIHERLFENPRWLVEGLATVFEQPAVYDLRTNRSTIESRMLHSKVVAIQPLLRDPAGLERQLHGLIESDQLFTQDAELAYALSWAMLFYLSERMPTEFGELLSSQSRRGFGTYSAGARVADFRKTVRLDAGSLALQMQRLFQRQ